MKKLSGIKVSHKISSLMIGLVVGFLLMAVAYYAQFASEKTINEANANFKSIDQLISGTLNSAAEIRTATPTYADTGDEQALSYYRGGKMQINESLNLLGSMNSRFVNKNALTATKETVKKLDAQFNALVDQQANAAKDPAKKDELKAGLTDAVVAMTTSLQDYRRLLDANVKRRIAQAQGELNIARTMHC